MNTILVSASTPGYADVAERLRRSVDAVSAKCPEPLSLYHECYSSSGDWVRNGQIKPDVLLRAVVSHDRKQPVCWVDADAELVDRPSRLDGFIADKFDAAVHRLHGKETLSGTVWVNCTPGGLWLLAQWQDECRRHPVRWDQHSLDAALKAGGRFLKVGELGAGYCWIPDAGDVLKKGGPVIVHHQASREVRAGTRSM